jgi:hypothetical protein
MRALILVPLALAAACSAMDNELDEITFKDGGGDSDSDSDGDSDSDSDGDGEGEPCEVMVYDIAGMDGVCQVPDATCEGGTYPLDLEGNCADGLVCCIGTDQCEKYPMVLTCSATECLTEGGPFGCPADEWCCTLI